MSFVNLRNEQSYHCQLYRCSLIFKKNLHIMVNGTARAGRLEVLYESVNITDDLRSRSIQLSVGSVSQVDDFYQHSQSVTWHVMQQDNV